MVVSLYFHIPFCKRKCDYCHFYVIPNKESYHPILLEGLDGEWALRRPLLADKRICSIYFGGGTPSLLSPQEIEHILTLVRTSTTISDDCEITLELNPENSSIAQMSAFRSIGINRVSIGIQSLDPQLLKKIGRLHDGKKAIDAVETACTAGISNISIDLMYDLPGQTLAAWQETVRRSALLPITHLSLYNMTLEPHTVFFKHKETIEKEMPDPDTSLEMYAFAQEHLSQTGFEQYEISAFARHGLISLHNTGYWKGRPFLGFGPSAFSYWKGSRFSNIPNLNRYHRAILEGKSPIDFQEQLDEAEKRRELLAIRLRLLEGINLDEFEEERGILCADTYATLKRLANEGLLTQTSRHYKLSPQGILYYDSLAAELI